MKYLIFLSLLVLTGCFEDSPNVNAQIYEQTSKMCPVMCNEKYETAWSGTVKVTPKQLICLCK